MAKLEIEVDDELLEHLDRAAQNWNMDRYQIIEQFLWAFATAIEEEPREREPYWESELAEARHRQSKSSPFVRCSTNLERALKRALKFSPSSGSSNLSTLSILWAIFSMNESGATRYIRDRGFEPGRLCSHLLDKTESAVTDEQSWLDFEHSQVYRDAYQLAEDKSSVTTLDMLRAILEQRANIGRLLLNTHGITLESLGWPK